jgi:hypothetical protein
MTGIDDRLMLDHAVADFRAERVKLLREGLDDAASELTVRVAEFLSALAKEARKARGIDDDAPPRRLHVSLATAPRGPHQSQE